VPAAARLELPRTEGPYRYRLTAGIVLAEVARQPGARPAGRPGRRDDGSALRLGPPGDADLVTPLELAAY